MKTLIIKRHELKYLQKKTGQNLRRSRLNVQCTDDRFSMRRYVFLYGISKSYLVLGRSSVCSILFSYTIQKDIYLI